MTGYNNVHTFFLIVLSGIEVEDHDRETEVRFSPPEDEDQFYTGHTDMQKSVALPTNKKCTHIAIALRVGYCITALKVITLVGGTDLQDRVDTGIEGYFSGLAWFFGHVFILGFVLVVVGFVVSF